MHRKKIHTVQTILLLAVIAWFAVCAIGLFTGNPDKLALLEQLGLGASATSLAIIELIIIATLLWRPTRMIGSLIATAYLGGAIALFIVQGISPIVPAIVLLVIWLIHKLNWWKFWHHGYKCGCKVCSMHRDESHEGKDWCECKPGCVCEKGRCDC